VINYKTELSLHQDNLFEYTLFNFDCCLYINNLLTIMKKEDFDIMDEMYLKNSQKKE